MNKKINKFILIYLIIQPFLDVITSLQVRNNSIITLGSIFRGIFFVLILVYLYKNKINKKIITMFLIYFVLAISYYFIYTKNNIYVEIINIFKIFYLPFLISFFNNYTNKQINDKLITIIYIIYLNFILIPWLFGFGFNIYKDYELKSGYIGLFYSGNEISAILIGLMPIVFNFIINSKNYLLKIFVLVETFIVVFLVGTKTLLLGLIIILVYFLIEFYKSKKAKKSKIIISIIIIIAFISFIAFLPKMNVSKNMKIALDYYKIDSISDIKLKHIDDIIFSKRIKNLKKIDKMYAKGSKKQLMYGIGADKILKVKDIEIDIFDLFFSIGIFGTIIYIISIYQKIKFKSYYKLSFILFILMSFFSGHVLLEPMVSIYIALLFNLNRQPKNKKKKILLVSNMYPNQKYKYFGSFVKNTKNILEEYNYDVDLSVKYRETKFFGKLFSYFIFYTKTTLKGIFNNYDYIYVHFISHSFLGTLIPILTSKKTKIIVNVHGNDVVADYDFEEKNVKRSKKYLKYADKVIVPSIYYKNVMMEKYLIDENKLIVYPSGGVDTKKFKLIDKDTAKKKCDLDLDKKYIGYISRIEKNKGYDTFLKAVKELEKENKIENKKFLIIGTGSEEEKMNKLIKELDILKYLEIRNMVSQDDLVYIYNSLDIFIFPTYRESESLGLVGLEAMSCEKIVIASKNYGPTDYLINKKNGLFFKPQDYKDLKNKILEAEDLNNEQKRKMIKKARETAIKYDSENTKDILINVFKE